MGVANVTRISAGRARAPGETAPSVVADGAPAPAVREERREDNGMAAPRERFEGKGRKDDRSKGKPRDRDEGGRDKGRGGRDRDRGGRAKTVRRIGNMRSSANPRERDRPIDPNSPFAKLAALKDQLTAARKDHSVFKRSGYRFA